MRTIIRITMGNTGRAEPTWKKLIPYLFSAVILFPLTLGLIEEIYQRSVLTIGAAMLLGTGLTLAITLLRINRKPDLRRIRKIPLALMMLTGLGILIAFFDHKTGWSYLLMAIDMLAVFPLYYLVETGRENDQAIPRAMAIEMMVLSALIYGLCLWQAAAGQSRFTSDRYFGPLHNPNPMSTIGSYGVMCGLYIAHRSAKTMGRMIACGFSAGCGMALLLLGAGRTSAVALAGCLLIEGIYLLRRRQMRQNPPEEKKTGEKEERRGRGAPAAFLLAALLTLLPAYAVREGSGILLEPVRIMTTDGRSVEKMVPAGKNNGKATGTLSRFVQKEESLDEFSNGRLDIWRMYFEHLTLRGRDPDVIEREVLKYHHDPNAHNNYLTVAYACGIPTGVLYLLWVISLGIIGIRLVFGKQFARPEYPFAAMMIFSFAVQSMLDVALFPFWSLAPCMLFLCAGPAMEAGGNMSPRQGKDESAIQR